MKLTTQQIKNLFHFTERHYVEHYDVQVEVVDHLASAIEERLEKNPNQVFEQVLDDVYQSFGSMGISGFIDSTQIRVEKKRSRIFMRELKSYFTIPKLFLTFILMLVLTIIFKTIEPEIIKYVFILSALFSFVIVLLDYLRLNRNIKKKLLAWKQAHLFTKAGGFINLPNVFLGVDSFLVQLPYFREGLAVLVGFLILFLFAELSTLNNVYKNLQSDYPEAFVR
jgi:hypothetical protein